MRPDRSFWQGRQVCLTGHSGFKERGCRSGFPDWAPDVVIHMAAKSVVRRGYEDPN